MTNVNVRMIKISTTTLNFCLFNYYLLGLALVVATNYYKNLKLPQINKLLLTAIYYFIMIIITVVLLYFLLLLLFSPPIITTIIIIVVVVVI